jgi:hypothetical protein
MRAGRMNLTFNFSLLRDELCIVKFLGKIFDADPAGAGDFLPVSTES